MSLVGTLGSLLMKAAASNSGQQQFATMITHNGLTQHSSKVLWDI